MARTFTPFPRVLAASILAGGIWGGLSLRAEEPKAPRTGGTGSAAKSGSVTGILTDKTDKYIMVKPEGAKEPQRFLLAPPNGGAADPAVQSALKMVFIPNLVTLQWQLQDEPVVTAIHPIQPKTRMGTVLGTIVARECMDKSVYIEVKPAPEGFTERYWPRFVGNSAPNLGGFDKEMIQKIGELSVGDRVKLTWVCDERKRATKVDILMRAPQPQQQPQPKTPGK